MNKLCCLIIMFITCGVCSGQNLVPNPSFEDTLLHTNCITGIQIANQWFNPNIASPDLYSYKPSCTNSSFNNPSGYQLPKTGLCYAGIYTYLLPNTREYVEIKLLDTLQANQDYQVSFFVSRAEGFNLAADRIGAYFSNDSALALTGGNLPFTPQISNPAGNILYDSINWVQISGIYHATGGEKFITIGNFYNTPNTLIDTVSSGPNYDAYYYIDDVSVTTATAINENDKNIFVNIYPSPVRNVLNIQVNNQELSQIIIYDIVSRKLLQQSFVNSTSINTEQFAKGIYLYEVRNKNGMIKKGKLVKD